MMPTKQGSGRVYTDAFSLDEIAPILPQNLIDISLMRIRNLATFVKVAHLGSFHAASQQLHASQPAISARIAALEEELGVKLFQRDKSGTRITARGAQLLPYAEKLLAISQEMREQVSEDKPERGTFRVGIADTLAYLWLSPLLQLWQSNHPLLSFELTNDVTPTLTHQLQQHQIDLALMVANETLAPDLVVEPLCSYPQCWVAAPSLVGQQQHLTLDTLATFPILSFPRDTHPWHYLQQLFSQCEEPPVVHTCSAVAGLLMMAEQGLGVTFLPEPLVKTPLEQGRLVMIKTEETPPELSFCYSWRLDDDRILPRLLAESGRSIIDVSLA